jgi:small conductance mechanosensitive channel
MPNPFAHPANFQTPEAAMAYAAAMLVIRLGLVVLGTVAVLRIAALLIGRLEIAIKAESKGDPIARENRARTLGGILRGISRSVIFIIAALMAVHELGLDITPAVAAAGGFGVAAGLGAQSLVRDWIAGFFIIHDNQYVVGDAIRTAGVAGTVEIVGLRHTELRDSDGSLHFIPNGEIKVVTNMTKAWSSPLVRIPVSLASEPARALAVLNEFLDEFRNDPNVGNFLREPPPRVLGVEEITSGQYTVLLQARTAPEHRYAVGRAMRLGAMTRLLSAGIALHAPEGAPPPAPPNGSAQPAPEATS